MKCYSDGWHVVVQRFSTTRSSSACTAARVFDVRLMGDDMAASRRSVAAGNRRNKPAETPPSPHRSLLGPSLTSRRRRRRLSTWKRRAAAATSESRGMREDAFPWQRDIDEMRRHTVHVSNHHHDGTTTTTTATTTTTTSYTAAVQVAVAMHQPGDSLVN